MPKTQGHHSDRQRPYYHAVGYGLDGLSWPIGDLDEWLAVTRLPAGRASQVLWREIYHCQYRHKNFMTPSEAARYARSLLTNQGIKLLDVGISAEQPIAYTEFAASADAGRAWGRHARSA